MIGVNHQNMNETNKYVLLKSIVTQAPISRAELSQITGLNKMTVTGLVNEYIEKGIVGECGEANSTGGRKRVFLDVLPDSLLTLGIYIGRDILKVGIINLKGQILQSESLDLSFMENNDVFIKSLFMLCDHLLETKYKEGIWGIGVSCAGPLLAKDGVILNPPDFNNIRDLPIVERLTERYKLPAYLQNDMCVAALAEVYFGNKQQYNNFIYVGISGGIGGGVIIDKKLYTGSSGLAGIIGHSIVEMDGIQCECGQCGCLEKYSSTRAAVRWAKNNGASKELTWMELLDKATKGDEICTKAIERMMNYLAVAIINMESAYDTECFVIGGDLHFCQDIAIHHIQEKLQKRAFSWGKITEVKVEPSSFMGSASFIGTVALVMENNLES
jgi:predicted NBD/HSP70 family sugar kinase